MAVMRLIYDMRRATAKIGLSPNEVTPPAREFTLPSAAALALLLQVLRGDGVEAEEAGRRIVIAPGRCFLSLGPSTHTMIERFEACSKVFNFSDGSHLSGPRDIPPRWWFVERNNQTNQVYRSRLVAECGDRTLARWVWGNVYENSAVCWGDNTLPINSTPTDLDSLFFGSRFNHDLITEPPDRMAINAAQWSGIAFDQVLAGVGVPRGVVRRSDGQAPQTPQTPRA